MGSILFRTVNLYYFSKTYHCTIGTFFLFLSMELVLKNISPSDYILIFDLARRLGIQVEEKSGTPGYSSIVEDLKEAVTEIKMAEAGQTKLQNARDLINEL